MSRALVRALVAGGAGTVAVPLALAPAARIQERDWATFLTDPTQLANGIRDLVDAVGPDGVPVTDDAALLDELRDLGPERGPHARAALEATRRLRTSLGDRVALVTVLPGPARVGAATGHGAAAGVELVQALGQECLAAGVDIVLLRDDGPGEGTLSTLANVAGFHQALALSAGAPAWGLAAAVEVAVDAPTGSSGVVVTDQVLPRDIDFTVLEDWIDDVHD